MNIKTVSKFVSLSPYVTGKFSLTYFTVKAISGVNSTNLLRAAFTRADPKSAIKLLNLTVLFALLGSA